MSILKTYTLDELRSAIVAGEFMSAGDALETLLPKMPGQLKRQADALSKTLKEIKRVFPEAEYYTASGGFNLLLGSPHDDNAPEHSNANRDAVAWGSITLRVGDGDF